MGVGGWWYSVGWDGMGWGCRGNLSNIPKRECVLESIPEEKKKKNREERKKKDKDPFNRQGSVA